MRVGVAAPVMQQSATPLGLAYHRNALTRETLLTLGYDGRPMPRVLESWESSSDGLTWRLKVRQGIQFHDGHPVRPQDVATFLLEPAQRASIPALRAVRADGEFVIVELSDRFHFLPEALAHATFERIDRATDADGKPVHTRYGTGPYRVIEESADHIIVRAVPNHYRGTPGIEQIEVRLFPDQRNAWSALMREVIDVLYEVTRESIQFVRAESSVNVTTFPRPYVYLLGLNLKDPRFADPRVRRALNQAVDRPAFVEQAMAGEGEPAIGHVWPKHWAFDASVIPPPIDPAGSIRLLEEAGLKLQREPGRMPARLRLRCMVHAPFEQLALVLQRQLARIDVDLQLEITPLADFVARIGSGEFDAFVFEMSSARTLIWPYRFWHSTSVYFRHGYTSADPVLDRMRTAVDDVAFKAAAVDLQRLFIADPPAIFLAWSRVSRAVSRRFAVPESGDDIYQTIARWTPVSKSN